MPRQITHRPTFRPVALAATLLLAGTAQAATYNWASGTYTPPVSGPAVLAADDLLNINSGGTKYLDGNVSHLSNLGTVAWNANALYLQNGGVVSNAGLWDSRADQTFFYNGGAATSFLNTGTFRKSGGTSDTTINAIGFVSSGVVDAQVGRIRFSGGASFLDGASFTGAGVVDVYAGVNSFSGAHTSSNLLISGGTVVGDAAVVQGHTRMSGGTLQGGWTVASGSTLSFDDGAFKYFNGADTLLAVQGQVDWTADNLYLQQGAQVVNHGNWTSRTDQTLFHNGGAATGFVNLGVFTKAGGTGSTSVASIGFVNHGTLDVQSGSLSFLGGSRFEDGSVFTGAGRVRAAGNNDFAGTQHSANLVLASGTHTGHDAALRGVVQFESGTLAGSWAIEAGQTLEGVDGGFKYLTGSLANDGTLRWLTGGHLYLQNGGVLSNRGLLRAEVSTTMNNNGGTQPLFINTGTVQAAAGTTLSFGPGVMRNDGGLIEAEAGAVVLFNTGASFNAGSRYAGPGEVQVSAGASFQGPQHSDSLRLTGGNFVGDGAVLDGSTRLAGGRLVGSWQVGAGATLVGESGGFKYVSGAGTVLDNRGTVAWTTGNALYLDSGGTVVNRGLWRADASTQILYNGGVAVSFTNAAGATLEAGAGTVFTLGGGTNLVNQGTLRAGDGATLQVQGSARFEAGSVFAGSGRQVVSGANTWAGSWLSEGGLVLESGTHTGDASLGHGRSSFTGGTLAGSWQFAGDHTLVLDNGSFKYLTGAGTVLRNDGRIEWATGNALYVGSGAQFDNRGTLELQADTTLVNNGGGASVVNHGLIVKTGGAGTFTIDTGLGFDNLGTVDVRSGTIRLPNNFVNRGELTGTGSFALTGPLTNEGWVAPGDGTGTLAIVGNLVQAAGGIFAVDLENLDSHDLLTISGTASLDGTLALACYASCSYAVGDLITILDSSGNLTGSFSSVTMAGFATGAFDVIYDTAADRVQLLVTETVTAVPEPGSMALLMAGLAAVGGVVARRRRSA